MRISWGYKIAAVYILFVIGIMFLVYKANNEHFDLVTSDYYEKELKYQHVIDDKQNVAALSAPVIIEHSKENIAIHFPSDFQGKSISGEAYLYCPSDAKKDQRNKIEITGLDYNWKFSQTISGLYEIKLSWKSGNKSFYKEEKLFF